MPRACASCTRLPSGSNPGGTPSGIGHAALGPLNTAVFSLSYSEFGGARAGMNCYWPMPFSNGARITIENECDGDVPAFYYYIDYDKLPVLPPNMGRFHAWWNRNNPCRPPRHAAEDPDVNLSDADNYLIADIRGRGHYVIR